MGFEKKVSDSESLIGSLHRRVNELEHFESLARSQQNYELALSTTREKHEQEIISLNEKLQNIQMNLQEKNVETDELRIQLEITYKNNEKATLERIETINHLNEQLHDCERKYSDLLTTSSLESSNQIETKRQLTTMTEDKEKLEHKCQELQSEIRTLREHLGENEQEIDNDIFSMKSIPISDYDRNGKLPLDGSLINENIRLKERIDEFLSNEKRFIEINEELQRKLQDYEFPSKRSYSSSSSSSNETVITTSIHMEKIKELTNQVETLEKDYSDLQEKYEYEKHELQTMLEQLREDVIELDKSKQFYIDLCEEKSPMDDRLQTKFDFELKSKLDDLRRILEEDYNEKLLFHKNNQEKLERDNQNLKNKYSQDLEQQSKEFYQEMEAVKIKHEKQIIELNNEIDILRTNVFNISCANFKSVLFLSRCCVIFCKLFSNFKRNSSKENNQLKENFSQEEEKLLNEIKELNELNQHQQEELLSIQKQTGFNQNNLQDIQSFQLRINNYENSISQYEEFRLKLENNLQKITQQRDKNKTDLKLAQDMLKTKEDEFNQLKSNLDECEKNLQDNKQQFIQYNTTINDLQKQIELQTQELNQTRLTVNQNIEHEYREKLMAFDVEKSQFEQRLQQANQALNLADCHLEQEISKIKLSLEQEYSRRYENDLKRHQYELNQLRQKLTKEIENKRKLITPVNAINNSQQDIEEIKKVYRTEIDRLYRENVELSQHQAKLIDSHQKQMEIMKKELDDGYNNVIKEFQREQTRLETRCDQLKQQLLDSQKTIEQLKSNLNRLKRNHFNELPNVKQTNTNQYDNKDQQNIMKKRIINHLKSLEQSNEALNQERTLHAKQVNEFQQTISSLQEKIIDKSKQHTRSTNEIKLELPQERLTTQRRAISRPTSLAESAQTDSSANDTHSDSKIITNEKLRGNNSISRKTSSFVQSRVR
ncbi:unnamed protein product [Rotaria sp. Silwood2]|nr:unnamed protein product [Rotaria sp. Silwood2]